MSEYKKAGTYNGHTVWSKNGKKYVKWYGEYYHLNTAGDSKYKPQTRVVKKRIVRRKPRQREDYFGLGRFGIRY